MKNYKNILLIVLALAMAWLIREKLNSVKYQKRVESNLLAKSDSISNFELKNGQQVASIRSLEVSEKELKNQIWVKDDSLSLMIKKFKYIKAAVVIKTVVQIDSIPIYYDVPVPCEFHREFKLDNPDYSLKGISTHLGITIKDLLIPNTQRLVLGWKRSYFKNTLTADITNSNPLIKTIGLSSQIATVPIKRFGVSVFAGYDIRLKPTVGVGVTYTPFYF